MVIVKFGNLGIDAIEKELGISFTKEDRDRLKATRQEQLMEGMEVVEMPAESWHFFDMPRQLELGSYRFFCEFQKMLGKYELKGRLTVSYELAEDEKLENHYQLKSDSGYPMYFHGHVISENYSSYTFYKLTKENKKSLQYSQVGVGYFHRDVLKVDAYISRDQLVPEGTHIKNIEKFTKSEIETPTKVADLVFMTPFGIAVLNEWKGDYISSDQKFASDAPWTYEEAKEVLKTYRKELRDTKGKNYEKKYQF